MPNKLGDFDLIDGDFVICKVSGRVYIMSKDLGVDPMSPKERIGFFAEITAAIRPDYIIHGLRDGEPFMHFKRLHPRSAVEKEPDMVSREICDCQTRRAEAAEKERDALKEEAKKLVTLEAFQRVSAERDKFRRIVRDFKQTLAINGEQGGAA